MIRARARRTVLTSEPTDQSARTVTSRVATYIVAHRVASSVARSCSRRHPIHRIERISSGAGRGRHASSTTIDRSRNDRTLATREARLSAEPFWAMDALAETMRCVVVVAEACMTASVCADRIGSIDRRCGSRGGRESGLVVCVNLLAECVVHYVCMRDYSLQSSPAHFNLQETLDGIATDWTDGAGGLVAEVVGALGAHAQVATREDGGVARFGETDYALVGFGEG